MATALIVAPDEDDRLAAAAVAERLGFDTFDAADLDEARAELRQGTIDVLLVDMSLPRDESLELLEDAERRSETVASIAVSGEPSVEGAVRAMRRSALDYLEKPLDEERLARRLAAVLKEVSRREALEEERFGTLIGNSEPMRELYQMLARVAVTDATVLLVGESGTGKELVARSIHERSARRSGPFVPVNCGAIPESLIESELFGHEKGAFSGASTRRRGVFERASGGTLFLDEITEMPFELQVRLLRVLETEAVVRVGGEERIPIDVRVVAATNRDAEQAVGEGVLREDLFYRLSVFPIRLPPLRDREGDIELLAEQFLASMCREAGVERRFSDAALAALEACGWPGNVRQLQNAVRRAFILSDDVIEARHLPRTVLGKRRKGLVDPDLVEGLVGASIAEVEKALILKTLERLQGNKKETATVLGISLKTLYNRLKAYGDSEEAGGA